MFAFNQVIQPLLVNLAAILNRNDPDLILTDWGDTWTLPRLLAFAKRMNLPLPSNRDPDRAPTRKAARTYFAYGMVVTAASR